MFSGGHRADKREVFFEAREVFEARDGLASVFGEWAVLTGEGIPLRAQIRFEIGLSPRRLRGGARVGRPRQSRIFLVFSGG